MWLLCCVPLLISYEFLQLTFFLVFTFFQAVAPTIWNFLSDSVIFSNRFNSDGTLKHLLHAASHSDKLQRLHFICVTVGAL